MLAERIALNQSSGLYKYQSLNESLLEISLKDFSVFAEEVEGVIVLSSSLDSLDSLNSLDSLDTPTTAYCLCTIQAFFVNLLKLK